MTDGRRWFRKSLGPVLEVSEREPYRSFEHHDRLGRFTIAEESRQAAFQIFEGQVGVYASIEVTFELRLDDGNAP